MPIRPSECFNKHSIDIVAGTNTSTELLGSGLRSNLWMELDLYFNTCGLSAVEILQSATSISADRFGFNDSGKIEVGKRADLLLIGRDLT